MIFRRRVKRLTDPEAIACDRVRNSDLFDAAWYLQQYPDVARAGFDPALHYLRHGAAERRNPGPWFDTNKYVNTLDESLGNINPLLHYLENHNYAPSDNALPARAYSNLAGYLRASILNPIVPAPFTEADLRCFAVMEAISAHMISELEGDESVKVSVIMPVRNRQTTLQRSIESVLAQTYRNFELIIIDDASDDNTESVIADASINDARVKSLRLEKHSGVCVARNVGLASATGSIIAYLDSDNTWLEDYLGAAVGAFCLLPDADAVYSGQYVYADRNISNLTAVRFGPFNRSLLEQHNYIDLNCFLHRAEVADSVCFDEGLERLVDWDFILKISSRFRVVSIPVLLSNYYLHAAENTITKTASLDVAARRILRRIKQQDYSSSHVRLEKKICIIIPSYQALDCLKDCIESLAPYLKNDLVEVVIVDNNSSDQVRNYLRELSSNKIKIILNDVNYGFSYAVNQGAQVSSPDSDILLLNNDAKLGDSSLEALQHVAYEALDIGIAVPRQILPAGLDDIKIHVPYADSDVECDVSLSAHHGNIESIDVFHDGRRVDLNFAPFFCAYIKREIWDECRGLDFENGRHYRSDRIMCEYIRLALGKRVVYTPFAKVYHAVQASTGYLIRSHGDNLVDEYRTMLIKNAWPSELRRSLKIKKRPWDCE